MKTCKDCKYCLKITSRSITGDLLDAHDSCCHPLVTEVVKLVVGRVEATEVPNQHMLALDARLHDKLCGYEGKWWEQA